MTTKTMPLANPQPENSQPLAGKLLQFMEEFITKHTKGTAIRNLSKAEVAQMLGVSIRTIETLLGEKKIDYVRIKGRILIPYDAVLEFNRNNIIKATDPPAQGGEQATRV